MARINVGYDFTVNEVPTQAKLKQMLTGMSIVAISPALINANLVSMNFGVSGTTLPGEGWLWADNAGSLWVRNTNGTCKLWRAQFGWSTNRFPTFGVRDTITLPRGPNDCRAELRNAINDNDTNESNVGWITTADSAIAMYGKAEDTAVSGVYSRWVMRGGCVWQFTAGAAMNMFGFVKRHTSPGQGSFQSDPNPLTTNSLTGPHYGNPGKMETADQSYGWFWGMPTRIY